jgi:hypothetical protein
MEYSFSCSYLIYLPRRSLARRRAHHGYEQVGDARPAYFSKRSELVAVHMIEQQNGATKDGALVNRLKRTCCRDMLGIHHYLHITRVEFFHAALEDDPAAIDKHEIGKDVLDLLDLMRRYDDRAAMIEVVVQQ